MLLLRRLEDVQEVLGVLYNARRRESCFAAEHTDCDIATKAPRFSIAQLRSWMLTE